MAKTPNPQVAKWRKMAAELERQGMKPPQIADLITKKGKPVAPATIRGWLAKERAPREPFRDRVIELLHEGANFEKIVTKIECSHENVRKIEREIRHELKKDYTFAGSRLTRYLNDPKGQQNERYTRYKSFQGQLVAHCSRVINTDPKRAGQLIADAIEQFEILRNVLQAPEKVRLATCYLVQVKSIRAARQRILATDAIGYETALEILKMARLSHQECQACVADVARRESVVLRYLRRFDDALANLDYSEALYGALGNSGHDAFSNGLGSCALARMGIYYFSNRPMEAVRVAQVAEERLVDRSETELHLSLRFNHALALLEIAGRGNEARSIIQELLSLVAPSPSILRLNLVYSAGRAAEESGDTAGAVEFFEDAYQYAHELQIAPALAALEADIARIIGDPGNFEKRISRLLGIGPEKAPAPPWLRPIAMVFHRALALSKNDFQGALALLRHDSGGNRQLPMNAAMAGGH